MIKHIINGKAVPVLAMLAVAGNANAADWVTTYDAGSYAGSSGTITFNDWGYTGPGGRTANDFSALNGGFGGAAEGNVYDPNGGIGQIQNVVTHDPDWQTPDAPQTVYEDFTGTNVYNNANLDSTTNFFRWAYTSPGGSTFDNMRIDYDGDYLVNQNDMNFQFYNYFDYMPTDGSATTPERNYTNLAFQPYALSDATGWCGSVMASHPNAIEPMAGQLTFDFAFDVYFQNPVTGQLSYSSTEVVRGFEMRSWGEITVDVPRGDGTSQQFSARAVVNNTNPNEIYDSVEGATADPNYHNLVSFMGADVIASGGSCGVVSAAWASGQRGAGVSRFSSLLDASDSTSCAAAGGTWQSSAFAGFAFLLRADGERNLEWFDESVYGPDPSAVPVPAAVWLFGSGLVGLIGFARRKRA